MGSASSVSGYDFKKVSKIHVTKHRKQAEKQIRWGRLTDRLNRLPYQGRVIGQLPNSWGQNPKSRYPGICRFLDELSTWEYSDDLDIRISYLDDVITIQIEDAEPYREVARAEFKKVVPRGTKRRTRLDWGRQLYE